MSLEEQLKRDLVGSKVDPFRFKSANLHYPAWSSRKTYKGHTYHAESLHLDGASGEELEAVFDVWLDAEDDKIAAIREFGYPDLARFLRAHSSTDGVDAVLLLFALSVSEGATLEYSDTSISVTKGDTTFGVLDGVIRSRFYKGSPFAIPNPKKVLDLPRKGLTSDGYFIGLYRHAKSLEREVHPGIVEALSGFLMFHPNYDFSKLYMKEEISDELLLKLEDVVFQSKDPIADIYRRVVPKFVPKTKFARMFGYFGRRPINPSITVRQNILNKIYSLKGQEE